MKCCSYCGTKLEENMKFCPECGQKLIMEEREPVMETKWSDHLSGLKTRRWLIGLLAAVVAAIIVIPLLRGCTALPIIESFSTGWLKCDFGLAWSVKGADQVYLNGTPVPAHGEMTVYPDGPAEYKLTAQNEGGEAEKTLTIAPATVTVTLSNGGERAFCGFTYAVTWASVEPQINGSSVTPGIHHVGLEYSSDGGKTWRPIATNESNDGNFPWTIPNTPSTTCLVRATIYCSEGNILGQDTSDDFFTIAGQCTVDLLTPWEGETINPYYYPNGYEVTWESEGNCIDHVELSYRVEGGSWQTIATDLANTGSYSWTVLNIGGATCFLQSAIYDSADNILCSDTNGPFYIG